MTKSWYGHEQVFHRNDLRSRKCSHQIRVFRIHCTGQLSPCYDEAVLRFLLLMDIIDKI